MPTSSDPVIQEAAERSARVLVAKLIPQLDQVRESLNRVGDERCSQQIDDLLSSFTYFVRS